jgi:hypothetical protein
MAAYEPPVKGAKERITYSPVGQGLELPFTGLSYLQVRYALIKTFGAFPIRLSKDKGHAGVLRAMGHAVGKENDLAFQVLADRVEKVDELELRDG